MKTRPARTQLRSPIVGEFPAPRVVTGRDTETDLVKERDAAIGAEMHAAEKRAVAEEDCDRLACERDELVVERDELVAAALPLLAGPVAETNTPPAAVLYEELAVDPRFALTATARDRRDLTAEIDAFRAQYAGNVT